MVEPEAGSFEWECGAQRSQILSTGLPEARASYPPRRAPVGPTAVVEDSQCSAGSRLSLSCTLCAWGRGALPLAVWPSPQAAGERSRLRQKECHLPWFHHTLSQKSLQHLELAGSSTVGHSCALQVHVWPFLCTGAEPCWALPSHCPSAGSSGSATDPAPARRRCHTTS